MGGDIEQNRRIVALGDLSEDQAADAARILRQALPSPSAYKAAGEAEAQVAFAGQGIERFGLAAVEGETVVGWIGAVRGYSHSLELHPLVVDPAHQRRGVGAALVAALEAAARAEGMLAIHLGADDDFGGTSLFGRELFPSVIDSIAGVKVIGAHPLGFYLRQGFEIVGLIPDANGPGKPDILMSKKIAPAGSPR